MTNQVRGMRNNNPLNIRYVKSNNWLGKVNLSKKDSEFEEFTDIKYGLRAGFVLLYNYIVINRLNTISKIISRWAPMNENNTSEYISTVSKHSGIQPHEVIHFVRPYTMTRMVSAMVFVECGVRLPLSRIFLAFASVIVEKGIQVYWKLYPTFLDFVNVDIDSNFDNWKSDDAMQEWSDFRREHRALLLEY